MISKYRHKIVAAAMAAVMPVLSLSAKSAPPAVEPAAVVWSRPEMSSAHLRQVEPPQPAGSTLESQSVRVKPWSLSTSAAIASGMLFGFLISMVLVRICRPGVWASIAEGRYRGAEHHAVRLRKLLSSMADGCGLMLWHAESENKVTLYGPWPELVGADGNEFTWRVLANGVVDKEDLLRSLQSATVRKDGWVYTYKKDIDGELIYFQSMAVPAISVNGQFLGLVGVRANITGALVRL